MKLCRVVRLICTISDTVPYSASSMLQSLHCALPLGDDVTTCFLKQNQESDISDIRNLNDELLDYADTSSFQDHSGANSGRADKVHCAFGQRVYGSIPPSSGLGLRLEN